MEKALDTITIAGKTYKLVPIEEQPIEKFEDLLPNKEELKEKFSIAPDTSSPISEAKPKISGYRERFKTNSLSPADVTAPLRRTPRKFPDFNADEMKSISSKIGNGDDVFYGPGTEMDG